MTTEPSKEYVKRCLETEDEMLGDAKLLLEKGRLKSATDRAYQSMHHAAQSILFKLGIKPPETHSGLISMFGKHAVETKLIDPQFGRMLSKAFELRQKSDYEVFAAVVREDVEDIVAKAEAFVGKIRNLVGE